VTKIIRRTKPTTISTTTTTTSESSTKKAKVTKPKTSEAPIEEIEFGPNNIKGKLVTTSASSTTKKSKISEAIDMIENKVAEEAQSKNKNQKGMYFKI
jgi:hypothetical protein